MCGRIALYSEPERLSRIFDAVLAAGLEAPQVHSYNVAPTRPVLGVVLEHPDRDGAPGGPPGGSAPPATPESEPVRRVIHPFRWGLIPSWAKDPSIGNRLFNARAETVAEKPSFRASYAARRTAVLADGFYEWAHADGGKNGTKQPYYLSRADGQPLALAGLWERWRHQADGEGAPIEIRSCTIVTTTAGADLEGIHDRMPVVLEAGDLERWLDPSGGRDEAQALLAPAPAGTLQRVAVGPAVGNVRNDSPDLIEPASG